MLLSKLAAYIREQASDQPIHIVRRQDYNTDDSAQPTAPPKLCPAKVVEGDGTLKTFLVERAERSAFTHFLDGIERSRTLLYWSQIPIFYGYVSAVIRQRDIDRRMSTWNWQGDEALYFPCSLVNFPGLHTKGVTVRDTGLELKEDDAELPMRLRDCARQLMQKQRRQLEIDLAKCWEERESYLPNRWLFRDGSLAEAWFMASSKRMVGVIKSHQAQYFPLEEQKKILTLQPGERSSIFEPQRTQNQASLYSWYLRLHANAGRDLYFGLIRVEVAKSDEMIQMADEISGWLMAERTPLSLPDSRWDRLLYPIRDCEQYLRSLAPSQVAIEAALAGL